MFTLEQIKAAHAKTKSGADFPQYVQDLIQLGLSSYEHYLTDGHITYYGTSGQALAADPKWESRPVADMASKEKTEQFLRVHQQGHSDYPTICLQLAGTGIQKWIVDMQKMTCVYYDKTGNEILVEKIPVP
jgi:uncharacterized protein YbcV (DUF1398 family)